MTRLSHPYSLVLFPPFFFPTGVTTNYSYDNASRLLNLEHLNPLNQILETLSYAYDVADSWVFLSVLHIMWKLLVWEEVL